MAECGDISPPEQDEITKLLEETSKKKVVVILAGKTGAGKTTLLQNMLGEKVDIVMSPDPTTDNVYSRQKEKKGKQLVIYDTPGLIGDEKEKKRALESWSEKLGESIDLVVCCVPVGGSSKFKEDGYPLIMQCLHKKFGPKIWEHCVVAYTYCNQALDRFQRKCDRENRKQVNDRYKEFIQRYSKCFQDELERLNVKNIQIKSIFDWVRENNDQYPGEGIILGIPAGDLPNDRVLPGIKEDQMFDWTDAMMLYWFMKCDLGGLISLIELMCGEEAKNNFKKKLGGLIIGGGAGAVAGGVAGGVTVGTLKAILVGALAGGAVGVVLGALIGMALGTTVTMRATAKKGSSKDDAKEEKKTK